jgi:hypothetical protein
MPFKSPRLDPRPPRRFIHEGSLLEWLGILGFIFLLCLIVIVFYNENPWANHLSSLGSPLP